MLDGVDLVVAITVSWIPLAADYTRFARDRSSAFWGTAGRLLPRGHLDVAARRDPFFSRDITDPAALPVAVAAGGLGAVLALIAVTADETDEAFANSYSAAVSIQNLAPELPQRALVTVVCVVATVGALTIDLLSYQSFLLMLGSFFVPLFGVLLADWLAAGARYGERDVFEGPASAGACSPPGSPGSRSTSGSSPSGRPGGPTRSATAPDLDIGATLPSFAVSVALGLAVATLGRRRF